MKEKPSINLSLFQGGILAQLKAGPLPSLELQTTLRRAGYNKSAPSFYAAISRLQRLGYLTFTEGQETVRGRLFKFKVFELTTDGDDAYREWQHVTSMCQPNGFVLAPVNHPVDP